MKWHYTDGIIHLEIDGIKHQFTLEDVIKQSSAYKERRKKTVIVFFAGSLMFMSLQLMGGGIPVNKDIFYYIGYFLTPFMFGGIIAILVSIYIKFTKREVSELDTILKENFS